MKLWTSLAIGIVVAGVFIRPVIGALNLLGMSGARLSVRGQRDVGWNACILPGDRNGLRFIRPLPDTNSADFV